MNSRRSASVGALPREKKHFVSRNESSSGASLDVRCACQYFQCDSLLPDRINPAGDSRPTSTLGFHSDWSSDHEHLHSPNYKPVHLNRTIQSDQLSTRSYNVGASQKLMDTDRISVRSSGSKQAIDASNPHIDLSFVDIHPELEEVARSRGLVVRRISDANEREMGNTNTFMAGQRVRQMSVGRLSSGGIGGREPDAWSTRSHTSLRRISRSPSKSDLYVADINISTTRHERQNFPSASASRRTSNVDLSHFASYRGTPALVQANVASPMVHDITPLRSLAGSPTLQQSTQQLAAPEMNLNWSTVNFERATASRQRSTSPTMDYRIAKPPVSTDYMRPKENKENIHQLALGELMPQNRPIEVSTYTSYKDEKQDDIQLPELANTSTHTWNPFVRASSPKPVHNQTKLATTPSRDPLQQVVAELENTVAHRNIEDIYDNIRTQTMRPPSIGSDSDYPPSLHLTEETNIQILSKVPTVDINKFIQNETQKVVEARIRSKSPSPSRPPTLSKSPTMMDTLQLPSREIHAQQQTVEKQPTLKRQRTPERNISPDGSKKPAHEMQRMEIQTVEMHFIGEHEELPLQDAPTEAKASYATRFKSIFMSNKESTPAPDGRIATPIREPSPAPMRSKSPSPGRENSLSPKSPKTPKFTGLFSKNKPTPISIVAGNTSVITRPSEKNPMSVKVTETFSLKVDEMDQYNTRPTKPPPSYVQPTPPLTAYSSRENVIASEQASVNIADAFAPLVIPTMRRDQFMAGNRTFYSSDIDIQSRRSGSELKRASKEASLGKGAHLSVPPKGTLISVPINLGKCGSSADLGVASSASSVGVPQKSLPRAPSADGRLRNSKLVRKSSFIEGRTQSQDRAQKLHGSHDDLFSTRMSKTVSFNFDERQSRLSAFESSNFSKEQKDKKEFIERTYFSRDHEYEPIAAPANGENASVQLTESDLSNLSRNIEKLHEDIKDAQDFQNDLEERYFSSEATTPRTDSRTDYEIHTSQVDSSALEELPLQPENRKKGFMASAQDRTRKMQAGIRNQAGKIKTKLRTPAKKPVSSSPKAKERKRFKAPEFSKMKMPEIKRPDMSKLTDFKRPEFTKFNKPDMPRFKLPEKLSTMKLKRSKSFKENEVEDEEMAEAKLQGDETTGAQPQKKRFDFNFGTYPRAFRKKKKPLESEVSLGTDTGTEGVSVIPSTETQPSLESSSSPQGDRGPGPVRSRWADKFSDVSYNDSEGSRYRRYGSEQESFERESSLERRMKDDLEETESGETQEMSIMGRVADTKQFAEFDEENRAIHEISKMRAGEFRRRPIVHQDSDLRSEDSKEVEGWTEKEIEKNKLLRKAELEAEASYLKYVADDVVNQENQSVASSSKKVVMEEIDDDEFFLRKRGVSEENIELRQYISDAIREGYDRPFNTLAHVGQTRERTEYREYDVPPPKPKRLNKNYRSQDTSQDLDFQRSEYGDDLSMSQNGSDFYAAPKRPMRKGRSRSKYSMDSQDFPVGENLRHGDYFDDDEDYLRPPRNSYKDADETEMNDLDLAGKQMFPTEPADIKDGATAPTHPQAPRRRKRDTTRESSIDKDSYMNGFGGRSVSNSRLQPTEDVIVYRTEHEYPVPLASAEKFTPSPESRKYRSTSRHEEDGRIAHKAESAEDFDCRDESQVDSASRDGKDKFVIDMMENDGYAVVRKENLPKPTPPARRKKFSRSPGERFTTISAVRSVKDGTPPPPERPPPPRAYIPSTMEEPVMAPRPKSATSLDRPQILEDDYEEPEALQQERPESPRNLQSGDIVNKMKFRPLPAPPRPPREKRQRIERDRDMIDEKIATSSTADSYDPTDVDIEEEEKRLPEVEVSTQTDPLPDDFECEEFEITGDMKIIEPRINNLRKTLDELLKEEELKIKALEEATTPQLTEEEQLARGLQRFRDANQRSMSERSRASSQADRSKSQSRPQTPSAIVIERRVSTPIPSQQSESMVEASLIVRPIDDLDLEEEELRREGLLTDSSQHSKSDVEATSHDEEEESRPHVVSDYSRGPSSEELDAALEELCAQGDSNYEEERDESDLAEINEDEFYEKRSNALLAKYRDYFSEETSQREKYAEQEVPQEYQSESEEIATISAASEDEHKIDEFKDEQKTEEEGDLQEKEQINVDEVEYPDRKDDLMRELEEESIEETTVFEEPPLPPPRRKSATAVDVPPTLSLVEQPSKELTPVPTLATAETPASPPQFPTHLGELEVERLRVHALQAGQIMVSQLHGAQISAEDLECKSGNLIVKNIALPEGFIEDIVERVRTTDRNNLLTVETQTSLQASREVLAATEESPVREVVPPPKPPRQRDLDAVKRAADTSDDIAIQQLRNYDEETQTDPMACPTNMTAVPPPVFATTEYLQSLPPPSMDLYSLRRGIEQQCGATLDGNEAMNPRRLHHHHHHHHRRHRRCESSCSECEDSEDLAEREETRSRSHSRRSCSSTRQPTEPQTVGKAGQQFVSACSLSIAHMINRLTAAIRGGAVDDKNVEGQVRHVPTIVALFVLVSFTLIVYLLSGRNVHTHHWDFFNPPGNGPRPT
ncbi:protein piccolo isoform X7 [Eurosta solidaginis]|uniref:protein piccolo isoform X7 n=1 Tax=Eurosta solidaginis TaxID=178769 RepID=UPI0035313DDC